MSEPKVHELKTWPTYWDAVACGEKTFEVRRNDRFFQKGDLVDLLRLSRDAPGAALDWCFDERGLEVPKALRFRIGSVLQGGQFGIEPGFCVFSLHPVEEPPNV